MLKVALVAVGLAGCSLAHAAEEDQPKARLPSLSVTSSATREVVPDTATLQLSVSAERPTAAAAAEETARGSQSLLAEIKAQGIDPRDIKTVVTVSPVYDDERGPQGLIVKRTLRGHVGRNYGRRLKTLPGLTPYEFICQTWTKELERFRLDPSPYMSGPNI